jgi:hypothetical protein
MLFDLLGSKEFIRLFDSYALAHALLEDFCRAPFPIRVHLPAGFHRFVCPFLFDQRLHLHLPKFFARPIEMLIFFLFHDPRSWPKDFAQTTVRCLSHDFSD